MILVTGANGFLGTHLIKKLLIEVSTNIRATYRTNIPTEFIVNNHPNLQWMACDILDIDAVSIAMQGVQQVYHCANSISFDTSDTEEMYHNNVEGTANIANA